MKKILALAALCAMFIGCASTPQEKTVSKMLKMQDEKTRLIGDGIIAGMGVGDAATEQMAYDEADLNARADVGREMESYIGAMFRNYEEQAGKELVRHKETVRKNIVSTTLRGATIVKMDMEPVEGGYKVYAVMTVNPTAIKNAIEEQLKTAEAEEAEKARFRSSQGYKDLEAAEANYKKLGK